MLSVRRLDARSFALLDGLAAFWLALWLVVAALTAIQVWSLSRLSDTAQVSARAVDATGQALQRLSAIPLVGEQPAELGDQVRQAAAELTSSAEQTRDDVRRLSVLLGVSIFLIPTSPVLGIYLPVRVGRGREVREVQQALRRDGLDPALEAYLAHRALDTMTYRQLQEVSADPAGDLVAGRHRQLARAELNRLGFSDSDR